MKNKISLLFFVVLVSVSFTGCSFMNRSKQQDIASWQMSKVNPELFNKRNLEYLQKNTTINPVLYASSSVYSGDVSGDEENEIVVISKDTIYIYNLAGNLLQEKTFEDMKFGGGILADIDEDSALKAAKKSQKIQKWIKDKEFKKVIFVKGKLLNIVI